MPDVRPRDGLYRRLDLMNATLQQIVDAHAALAMNVAFLAEMQANRGTVDADRTYSRAETARLLNVSTRTVDRRIRDGDRRANKKGNTIRIDGASLRQFRGGVTDAAARRVLKL